MNTLSKILLVLGLMLPSTLVLAVPPYDVTVTVTAPTTGGQVDSYELFLDGTLVGVVVTGANTFPNLLTADGTYTFRVDAINTFGRTQSDPVTVAVAVPGKPSITIVIVQ